MAWSTGDVYDGEWVDGVIEGKGVMVYADGARYEGSWKGDVRSGQVRLRVEG